MSAEEVAAMAAAAADETSIEAMFDPSKKKKKKKAAKKFDDGEGEAGVEGAEAGSAAAPGGEAAERAEHAVTSVGKELVVGGGSAGAGSGAEDEFNYDDMLGNLYALLHANNPELTDRQRKKLKPPQVMRVGSTRSAWTNFKECCAMMKRAQEHVMSFFLAELGTTGSIDGSERFLIRGKYPPKYVENLLRKYITEYVKCHMCNSLETELHRDPISRLFFLNCKSCGSQRSVAPIKAGFHATARGERKKARAAAES